MEPETSLAVVEQPINDLAIQREPSLVLLEAQKAAQALKDVISRKAKPVILNGEQYLEFEDWSLLGRFYGITAKVLSTKYVEFGDVRGFEAHSVAFHVASGKEISGAESMCLNDEANWSKKPLFQLKSMAQTRACAKVLRNVLSWVVVMAGYKPTPSEEMPVEIPRNSFKNLAKTDVPPSEATICPDSVTTKMSKKGTPYWLVHFKDKNYTTFDLSVAELAKQAAQDKHFVKIVYQPTKFGAKIESLSILAET